MPRINKVLKRLLTTEKTAKAQESQNKYVFEVLTSASQSTVAKEVAVQYKVDVEGVNLMVIPGKKRRISKTQRFARLPKWKKAVVKLKEGQKIEEARDDKKSAKKADKRDDKKEESK